MNYNQLIAYIGTFVLLINVIIFLKGFSSNGKTFKILSFYLVIIFLIQLALLILWNLREDNIFLSHFYFIIQFVLLTFFYKGLFKNNFQKKLVDIVLILVLAIIGIQYGYDKDLFLKFNLFEIVLTSVPLIMYSIVHFYNMLGKEKEYFYVNSGVLIYLTGSTLLFVAGNYIVASNSVLNKSIWIINSVLFVVYQILIFIEWKKSFYRKKIQ